MADQVKIEFRVEPDEDGYPPIGVERLWATPMPNGHYIVDNTPFYVSGISAEDEVSVVDVDGTLRFEALVRASGISTSCLRTWNASTKYDAKSRRLVDVAKSTGGPG